MLFVIPEREAGDLLRKELTQCSGLFLCTHIHSTCIQHKVTHKLINVDSIDDIEWSVLVVLDGQLNCASGFEFVRLLVSSLHAVG